FFSSRRRHTRSKRDWSSDVCSSDLEKQENNSGNLCAQLANDPSDIQTSTGSRIAMFCQAMSSLVVAIAFGLYTCWNLSLLALARSEERRVGNDGRCSCSPGQW